MTSKKTPKNAEKYICIECNFKCSKKSDYIRHEMTAKHQILTNTYKNTYKKTPKNATALFVCECGKEYKHRQSLNNHKQKCMYHSEENAIPEIEEIEEEMQETNDIYNMNTVVSILKQNQEFKELMIEQSNQMKEIQQELQNQQSENQTLQKQLIEAVKDGKTINNNTINNNNNQRFNLNFFLNTTCKDAMNMSEFIENINIEFQDIENIGKNGYVAGMTNMILSRIKDLDVTKRPLHCTDLKRDTMYIKDNNEWSKDTPDNLRLRKMITIVAEQNYGIVPLWREKYPECRNWDNPKYDFCIDMMRNILGDMGEDQIRLDNKIIKNLSKHIMVDKQV